MHGVFPGVTNEMSTKRSSTALSTSSHERCPSCDRQFGPKAFDRHVEWCKEHKARLHKSPATVLAAKERLDARIKYKVPPLTKSKKSLVREKYSSISSNGDSPSGVRSVSNISLERSPSVRKPRSVVDLKKDTKSQDKLEVKVQSNRKTVPKETVVRKVEPVIEHPKR